MNTTQQTEVEKHNSYGWIKPDADACGICGRKEFASPVEGFQVRECNRCERLICERCAEIDCGGEGEGVSWQCSGDAREQCRQIADGILWAEQGLATGKNDSCQRCSKKYGEPSPECPNRAQHEGRDYASEFENAATEICERLADNLEAVDRKYGIESHDYSALRRTPSEAELQQIMADTASLQPVEIER